ncbi:phytanoyl-CoA dioxygenase, peroxisomal-like [Anticarsia gemmatalis]|uniref:phytanoyl-CoA dioxygenase, peroxisomal-like n=1 Tax=Anticarsia gemmatalis TaxID=129554 RepID=UPI003F76D0EC
MMACNKNYKFLPKCVAAVPSDTYLLTPEQLRFYHDNGFLVIKKLFGPSALHNYRQRFIDVCNGRVKRGQVAVVKDRALCKPGTKPEEYINKVQELMYDPVYCTYFEDPRLLHVVAQLIGDQITAINCMLINKPPGTSPHPPHQDLLYFPFRPAHKIVASWTAIDPVSKDNGCLFVIPGSHKPEELYEHRDLTNESKQFFYGIVDWQVRAPEHKRVHLEMEPGDTVFFNSALVHGSLANTTKVFRKALTCHFANSNCHYIDVAGTAHEGIAKDMEKEVQKRGGDLNYVDLWRIKTKIVRGNRCNL